MGNYDMYKDLIKAYEHKKIVKTEFNDSPKAYLPIAEIQIEANGKRYRITLTEIERGCNL